VAYPDDISVATCCAGLPYDISLSLKHVEGFKFMHNLYNMVFDVIANKMQCMNNNTIKKTSVLNASKDN